MHISLEPINAYRSTTSFTFTSRQPQRPQQPRTRLVVRLSDGAIYIFISLQRIMIRAWSDISLCTTRAVYYHLHRFLFTRATLLCLNSIYWVVSSAYLYLPWECAHVSDASTERVPLTLALTFMNVIPFFRTFRLTRWQSTGFPLSEDGLNDTTKKVMSRILRQ